MEEHDFKKYPELTNQQISEFGLLSPHVQLTEDFDATVVKVHDGDTVTLRTSTRDFDFPIRFLDIDAPELGEGGEEARDWLEGVILGEEVRIVLDTNNRVDKYGRLLGRVLSRGLDVADMMLSLGLVQEFGRKNEGRWESVDKIFRVQFG